METRRLNQNPSILGYYEWRTEEGVKQPYLIRNADDKPLFLGGLWETWRGDDESLLSCTVLTRKPLASIKHIHNRMPVVIPTDQLTSWFEVAPDAAKVIAAESEPDLEHYAVSRYVNNARNDGPKCVVLFSRCRLGRRVHVSLPSYYSLFGILRRLAEPEPGVAGKSAACHGSSGPICSYYVLYSMPQRESGFKS